MARSLVDHLLSAQPNPDERGGPRGYIRGKDGVYRSPATILHMESQIGSMHGPPPGYPYRDPRDVHRGAPRPYPYGGHGSVRA